MHKEQDKYQNILTHLHELNRQNLLNENDKNEYLSFELDKINQKISNSSSYSSKRTNKLMLVIILVLIINTALLLFLLLKQPSSSNSNQIIKENNKIEKSFEEDKVGISNESEEDEIKDVNLNSFNQEDIIEVEEAIDEDFKSLTPIIRRGTKYTCKDEDKVYKIPFTTDIKGKLYSNRFDFILQQNKTTKECSIKKGDM
jgi:hypothetical protein